MFARQSLQRYLSSFFALVLFVGLFAFFLPEPIFAQDQLQDFGNELTVASDTSLLTLVARIINIALSFLGIAAVGIVLYGGFMYLTAGGSDEKVNTGRKILRNGLIGLIIIFLSYSLANFVVAQLRGAAGLAPAGEDVVDNGGAPPLDNCFDIGQCNGVGNGGGDVLDQCLAEQDVFVVKSISPNTNDGTGMLNTKVRILFSRAVDNAIDPAETFTLLRGGEAVNPIAVNRLAGGRMIEAEFGGFGQNCNVAQHGGCLDEGMYEIAVNDTLSDEAGNALSQENECGEFPIQAQFENNLDDVDQERPSMQSVRIDGQIVELQGEQGMQLAAGDVYLVETSVEDRLFAAGDIEQGGVSYVHMEIEREVMNADDPEERFEYYMAPSVAQGTDARLDFSYRLRLGNNIPVPARYRLTMRAHDIDGNTTEQTVHFVVVGANCNNGVLDEGEDVVDAGGVCLSNDACTADWQCQSQKCIENQCVAWPMIQDVSPWSGAAGNWITISGQHFGNIPGQVSFGVDQNNDGELDEFEWVDASLAACQADTWTDNWVVVEVPDDAFLPQGSRSEIRVRKALAADAVIGLNFEDTTRDDHGPVPDTRANPDLVPDANAGYFIKNNIQTPGLCSIKLPGEAASIEGAVPGTDILAEGTAFGELANGELIFGGVRATVAQWNERSILAAVPRLVPDRVAVTVNVNGVESNAIPFRVLSEESDENRVPVIDEVAPQRVTPGSYVSIFGRNFGVQAGRMYLAADNEAKERCGIDPNACIEVAAVLPESCGVTWKDTQVIAQMPKELALGDYLVVLRNSFGQVNAENILLTVEDGPTLPSICAIQPGLGSAPLPLDNPLRIVGTNLSDDGDVLPRPKVYFWQNGADAQDVNTWLSSDDVFRDNQVIRQFAINEIETILPENEDGYSMNTGPIRVQNESGLLSNPIQYEVRSCIEDPRSPLRDEGYRCCTEGADAGLWRHEDLACAGEDRDAGYVWRFSTGNIPTVPRVVEQCQVDELGVLAFPSPAPWDNWGGEEANACLNAAVAVRFTVGIDENTISNDTVRMYRCKTNAAGKADCSDGNRVEIEDIQPRYEEAGHVLYIHDGGQDALLPDQWYHIELLNGIQSQEVITTFGEDRMVHYPLQATRPCDALFDRAPGEETRYCFEFKTAGDDQNCSLREVGMNPGSYTVDRLGRLLDPRYLRSDDALTDFFNPAHVLYYHLWGRGDQLCQVLPVDGLGWDWTVQDFAPGHAKVAVAPDANQPSRYTDSRATVDALADTNGQSIRVLATLPEDHPFGALQAKSSLVITLEEPQVVRTWPDCTDSCTNAIVALEFNRPMMENTYANGLRVYRCLDSLCLDRDPNLIAFDVLDASTDTLLRARPQQLLEEDTWYLAEASDAILSIGRIQENGEHIAGVGLEPYQWRFRTKAIDGECVIDSVRVNPVEHLAQEIGEQTRYSVIPFSAPDQCSAEGQELDPWGGYGWEWQVENAAVASVSAFTSVGQAKSSCSVSCLPVGSDILRTEETPGLCGNGVLDAGEDCDLLFNGFGFNEIAGVSCSYNCLRPGAANLALCGDGIVAPENGEECDPADPRTGAYCTQQCQWTGSSQDAPAAEDVNAPWCGNGEVTFGEDCDLGIAYGDTDAPETSARACSNQCLHEGTALARSWCQAYGAGVAACDQSVSVCGNNVLEEGEECELVYDDNGNIDETKLRVVGTNEVIALENQQASSICSNYCLLDGNLCTEPTIPAGFEGGVRCEDPDLEYCSEQCHILGSSPLYRMPSFCGNGVSEEGEFAGCELTDPLDQIPFEDQLGQNPVQVVTALGQDVWDMNGVNENARQETDIIARAVRVRRASGNVEAIDVEGTGSYALQCGYEEFEERDPNFIFGYNNCPNNIGNKLGVSSNSCCFARPYRIDQYPAESQNDVCLNTAIRVEVDQLLDPTTVTSENVFLVQWQENPCVGDARDVSDEMRALLPDDFDVAAAELPFFARVWDHIQGFFADIFGAEVRAQGENPAGYWCEAPVQGTTSMRYLTNDAGEETRTEISLAIDRILQSNTTYMVYLNGDQNGIKNLEGVGMRGVSSKLGYYERNDAFGFTTGEDVCRLRTISVDPPSFVFTAPNTRASFSTLVQSSNGQEIQAIPDVYDWRWQWGPENHPVFSIPAENASATTANTDIAVQSVEGELVSFVQAVITADLLGTAGDVVSGFTQLEADFCERPWPARGRAYEDERYHVAMNYCADAGIAGEVSDDLPFLRGPLLIQSENAATPVYGDINRDGIVTLLDASCVLDASNPGCEEETILPLFADLNCDASIDETDAQYISEYVNTGAWNQAIDRNADGVLDCKLATNLIEEGSLAQYVFFNDRNEDVIGMQVFANPNRNSARAWFTLRFPEAVAQDISFESYDGVSTGDTVYINALNQVTEDNGERTVYNNIYQFTLSRNAQASTREVFDKLLNSLEFNTNIENIGYCLHEDVPSARRQIPRDPLLRQQIADPALSCQTDFDCRDQSGVAFLGTNGMCSNAQTKFLRDWNRLSRIDRAQEAIESYRGQTGEYPQLAGGSYIPGYTNSRLPSWGALGADVGGLSSDNINQWSTCGRCAQQDEFGVFNSCVTDADCAFGEDNFCQIQDAQTCWDPASEQLICPQYSSVFEYSVTGRTDYMIHAPLEYFDADEAIVESFLSLENFSDEVWCRPEAIHSPFAARCGDGVVSVGEQCDPPGTVIRGHIGYNPNFREGAQGQCSLDNQNACVNDADCTPYRVQNLKGSEVSVFTNASGYCAIQGDGNTYLYPLTYTGAGIDVNADRYEFFGCTKAIDCVMPGDYIAEEQMRVVNSETGLFEFDGTGELFLDNGYLNEENKILCLSAGIKPQQCINDNVEEEVAVCEPIDHATAPWLCNNECQFEYGMCEGAVCGDGVIAAPIERCDDGALNGRYGQCNDTCTGPTPAFCGNGTIDQTENGAALEYCEAANEIFTTGFLTLENEETISRVRYYSEEQWDNYADVYTEVICGWKEGNDREVCFANSDVVFNAIDRPFDIGYRCAGDNRFVCDPNRADSCTIANNENAFFDIARGQVAGDVANPFGNLLNPIQDIDDNIQIINGPDLDGKFIEYINANTTNVGPCVPAKDVRVGLAYHPDKEASCALDCQGYGAYCGDGIVQEANGEICDDGNENNNDRCSNTCQLQEENAQIVADILPGTCGNGALNFGEVCDLGAASNGIPCDPSDTYGESCSYCSADCSQVIRIDATAYCGNGQIDRISGGEVIEQNGTFIRTPALYESCDNIPGNEEQLVVPESRASQFLASYAEEAVVQSLEDTVPNQIRTELAFCNQGQVGNLSCSADCRVLARNCSTCGLFDDPEKAVSDVQLLNPLVSAVGGEAWYAQTESMILHNPALSPRWGDTNRVDYLMNPAISNLRLESNALCVNDYSVYFNYELVSVLTGLFELPEPINIEGEDPNKQEEGVQEPIGEDLEQSKETYERFGDFFSFAVNGEDVVSKEYVLSPAVPEGSFRAVLRWNPEAVPDTVTFIGGLYNQEQFFFNGDGEDNSVQGAGVVDYLKAQTQGRVCELIEQEDDGYWWPTACFGYARGFAFEKEANTYVHNFVNGNTLRTQAMTIGTEGFGKPFAFFVRAVSANGASGAILDQYIREDLDLRVDVYTYKEDQLPSVSLYQPSASFQIMEAERSANLGARYWHAFNLVREGDGYTVQSVQERRSDIRYPHGSIETGFAQILCNVPNHVCALE